MPYLTKDTAPLAIAHRGGSLEVPENTMRAFSHAVELGYQYIETDVRMTKDGTLVIFHDKTVDRLTDGTGKLSNLTWDQVSDLRVGSEPVPRVVEALKTWPDIYWNLDPKMSACVRPLARIIQDLDMTEKVCIGSFMWHRQRLIKKLLGPKLITSAGPFQVLQIKISSRFSSRFGQMLLRKKTRGKYECLQVPLKYKRIKILDKKFIKRAHTLGLAVHIWTIDDHETIEELLDMGVDGIMTDCPNVLKDAFIHKNIWNSVDKSVKKNNL